MKSLLSAVFLILPTLFLFSCGHEMCCDPAPPNPGGLFLNIKHNGQPYPDSLMTGVMLYYYYNGQKISDPNKAPSRPLKVMYDDSVLLQRVYTFDGSKEVLAPGVFSSIYALDAVVVANIHEFYLQFPDGIIDTLNINVENVQEKDIASVPCNCLHQITSITMNGKPLQSDTTKYTMYSAEADNSNYLIQK